MKMYLVGVVGLFLVGVSGCGGGGDPAPDPAAVAKCSAWTAAICDRVVACGSTTTRATCLSAAASQVDCGQAVEVSATYDRCMMELPTFDCAVFAEGSTLPASCRAVILVSK